MVLKKSIIFRALHLSFLFLFANCTKEKIASSSYDFKIHIDPSSPSKDPQINLNADRLRVLALVYEPLLTYSYQNGEREVTPLLLSETPTISGDQQTFSFKIKPGVKFHASSLVKGRTVTSKDVVLSLLRGLAEENSTGYGNLLVGLIRGLDSWSKTKQGTGDWYGRNLPIGISVKNELEFSIQLTRKHPDFLALLTLPAFSVVPHEILSGANIKEAVGTGPFEFEDKNLDSKNWNLRANENYFRSGAIAHKQIEVTESDSSEDIKKADFAGISLRHATELVDSSSGQVRDTKSGAVVKKATLRRLEMLVFNLSDPLIKKLGLPFRKAFMAAIDPQLIVSVSRGFGEPNRQFIPPNVDGGLADPKITLPSADAARKTLSSILGKKTMKITFPETAGYWVEALQKSLHEISPNFEFEPVDAASYLDKIEKKDFQIAPISWEGDLPEATNYLQLYYGSAKSGGQNLSSFRSTSFDSLFDSLSRQFPSPERKKMAEQAHKIILMELPAIPLGFRQEFVYLSSKAANYAADHMGSTGLKDLLFIAK